MVWASGTVCISLYRMVPSAHKKANFLLGSRRTGARASRLSGWGRAEKSEEKGRIFALSALFRPSAVNQL